MHTRPDLIRFEVGVLASTAKHRAASPHTAFSVPVPPLFVR